MDSNYSVPLYRFYNMNTLNIFCDASMKGSTGCFCAVAVCCDQIIDQTLSYSSKSTNNSTEIRALRAAVELAYKWNDKFPYINIFSDSQVSIFGVRDYIYHWRYNPMDQLLYGTNRQPVKNQSIFIETFDLLQSLNYNRPVKISLWHQAGHTNNSYQSIRDAASVFCKSNNVKCRVDLNLIRYISAYNDYVDRTSRSALRHLSFSERSKYTDPVTFYARGNCKV